MEFREVVRRRRMIRAYRPDAVPTDVLDRVLDAGRRAPSAGNSQGWDFVVLEGPEETSRYWDITFPADRRADFGHPGLFAAPVLVVALANPRAYVERYRRPDKAGTGLGTGTDRWPVPYWTVDTSFAAMAMLLAAVDEGLGALFFGIFAGADRLLAHLGVPPGHEPIGTIALGWPDPAAEAPGRSGGRPRRDLDDVVHRRRW
ncbi:MAG: nitroreductase family protein [Acidimicrobiia bacterium]